MCLAFIQTAVLSLLRQVHCLHHYLTDAHGVVERGCCCNAYWRWSVECVCCPCKQYRGGAAVVPSVVADVEMCHPSLHLHISSSIMGCFCGTAVSQWMTGLHIDSPHQLGKIQCMCAWHGTEGARHTAFVDCQVVVKSAASSLPLWRLWVFQWCNFTTSTCEVLTASQLSGVVTEPS